MAASATRTGELEVHGAFDLRQSAEFGFGQRPADAYDGVMRLAFCLDGYGEQVAVAVSQPAPGTLRCEVQGPGELPAVLAQVARVVSVDIDATGYDELGAADPLVGRVQAARPGLRPPLFYSAYEAAAWSVLSARRPLPAMAALRERLSAEHGRVFEVAGQRLTAMPTPRRLLAVAELAGLPEVKLRRLHGVAQAALAGDLDTERLRRQEPAETLAAVQRLAGIGPFYAQLIVIRALGLTDVLPSGEPLVLDVAGRLQGRASPLSQEEYDDLARPWSPWRTWVSVAIRAAGPLVLGGDGRD